MSLLTAGNSGATMKKRYISLTGESEEEKKKKKEEEEVLKDGGDVKCGDSARRMGWHVQRRA